MVSNAYSAFINHIETPSKERRYDQWPGNPKGIAEDKTRCAFRVKDWSGWHFVQCSRKRGYGPNGEYCKQHAKKVLEASTP